LAGLAVQIPGAPFRPFIPAQPEALQGPLVVPADACAVTVRFAAGAAALVAVLLVYTVVGAV